MTRINPAQCVLIDFARASSAQAVPAQLHAVQQLFDSLSPVALRECASRRFKIIFEMNEAPRKAGSATKEIGAARKRCGSIAQMLKELAQSGIAAVHG